VIGLVRLEEQEVNAKAPRRKDARKNEEQKSNSAVPLFSSPFPLTALAFNSFALNSSKSIPGSECDVAKAQRGQWEKMKAGCRFDAFIAIALTPMLGTNALRARFNQDHREAAAVETHRITDGRDLPGLSCIG
jgi:hypothetical protein